VTVAEGALVADASCKRCKAASAPEALIEGLCGACVFALVEQGRGSVSNEEIRRRAQVVRVETAGLFSEEALLSILGRLWDSAEAGADREEELERAALEIQRYGGLGASRDMMGVAEGFRELSSKVKTAIEDYALTIEEEVRRKIRILSQAGRP
jgi:hypothetical protein